MAEWWAGGQSAPYVSESPYNPKSPQFNPYAYGNQSFMMAAPGGQTGYNQMSPVSSAIYGQAGYGQQGYGQMGVGPTTYGQQPTGALGAYQQGMPQGGMDPRYFQGFQAPSMLMGQQFQQQQTATAEAIERAKGLLSGTGIPAEGGLGDLEQWAEQRAALESQPIRKNRDESMRVIEDQWARKGSALGSEHERNVSEVQGASLSAMRSSAIGAAIDAFMKRPQLLAQMIAASR